MAVNKVTVPSSYTSTLPSSRVSDLIYNSNNSGTSSNAFSVARAGQILAGVPQENIAPLTIYSDPATVSQLGREHAIATSGNNGAGSAAASKLPTNTTTDDSGSSNGSSGDSSGGSILGNAFAGLGGGYDYASMMQSMLEQQRAAAQAAYNNAMGRLQDAWGNTQNALRANLDSTLGNLENQYNYSSDKLNNDASKSLREAYINYMLNKKNLAQGLSAMGLSGGATESTQANMYNNYGNSRNNINTTLNDNLASLLNNYQNNVANANQLYNTQYADAINNFTNNINALESALASNLVGSYSGGNLTNLASFANQLGQLTSNLANAQYTPTQNTLGVNAVSTTQANDMGTYTDYAKYLLQQEMAKGATQDQAAQIVMNSTGMSADQLWAALRS